MISKDSIEVARELVGMSANLYHAAAALNNAGMVQDASSVATKAKAILNEAIKTLDINIE